MIKNYFIITFRNLLRNKLFIFINVFGMGLAIASCITAYLNWKYMSSWDSVHLNGSQIYRVQFWREFQGKRDRYGMAPMALGNYIKQNVKEVDKTVRYMSSFSEMRIRDEIFRDRMAYADSAFFDLFTFSLVHGSYSSFHDKGKVLISDRMAKKYFNKEDVVGQLLTQIIIDVDGVRRPKEFEIGGVFKTPPQNNSFNFEAITYFDNFWGVNTDIDLSETSWKGWVHVLFLRIDDASKITSVVNQLQSYVEPQNKVREDFKVSRYYLENFIGMMKRNEEQPRTENDFLVGGIPNAAVVAPSIMAGLLLLLACFNFTNTSIAISGKRLKEIGIRKVMGGMRHQLIFQFLGENLALCFLGLLAGLIMAEWMVPAYDNMWAWLELKLSYTEHSGFLLFLGALLLITALIAGSYPAFYITSFEPVSILKGKAKFGGTNWFTRILLGGQFLISLLAIIMSIAFYQNGEYQRNYDLGYATNGIITARVTNEAGYTTYRDALSTNKDIELIAGTFHHVVNRLGISSVKFETKEFETDIMEIGDNYFEAMKMTLLNGRKFERDSETDRKESILVTEEFVEQFKWKDNPIGKRVTMMDTASFYIVGVVKNVYTRALWNPIRPLMIRYAKKEKYQQVLVKTESTNMVRVNDFMQMKWKEVFPNTLYTGQFVDFDLQQTNEINKNVFSMFGFLGFFAALMTGIGLFTLVSLNIEKKMKEIGVRKVLGASVSNIAVVINAEFIIKFRDCNYNGSHAWIFYRGHPHAFYLGVLLKT
jgi:putative ABC transport system permease protein